MSVLIQRILSTTLQHFPINTLPKFRRIVFNNSIANYYGKMSAEKPNIVFVLGAPGAGKGKFLFIKSNKM